MTKDPFDQLLDPDVVGSSEYRAVYEFVETLRDSGLDILQVQSSVDELSRWARKVLIDYTRVTNVY